PVLVLQWLSLAGILVGVHPRILNPAIEFLGKLKPSRTRSSGHSSRSLTKDSFGVGEKGIGEKQEKESKREDAVKLEQYPIVPLLGELGFVVLRGVGFLLTFLAVHPSAPEVPLLLGAFSLAWLLGLVVPGAPGGVGVFEATAIALLQSTYSAAVILSVVALYRLISVLAEGLGAGLGWLVDRR
ncbi:MAG TPA: lysylphosphatidylglycerol synthase domain-containing protein, partial [Thermosynechococcaceae cyanobacterium]